MADKKDQPTPSVAERFKTFIEEHLAWVQASIKRYVAEAEYARNAVDYKTVQPLRLAQEEAKAKLDAAAAAMMDEPKKDENKG